MNDIESHVSISRGNAKMGSIPSVSLPALITCSPEACKCCGKKCYALRISRLRPKTVGAAYKRNLDILKSDPEKFWREVNAAVSVTRFFRFAVSGDIYDKDYLENMVKIAKKNKHCQLLCFTKKFAICNEWLSEHKSFHKNLHIIFSGWKGITIDNPFNLPEAHVFYRDGTTTAKDGARYCSGNCYECAITNDNCWSLKNGEQIIFKEH